MTMLGHLISLLASRPRPNRRWRLGLFVLPLLLAACGGGGGSSSSGGGSSGTTYTLTVSTAGTGSGTVTSSPAGINCGTDCSEAYNQGTIVTLTATADTGSTFTGWSGDCSGSDSTATVTMGAAKTCTASFVPTHTLTVSKAGGGSGTVTSSPAGINCGTDCSEAYNQGTIVTLTATADTGSGLSGWGGDCASAGSSATATVTMDAAKSCTATFVLLPDAPTLSLGFGIKQLQFSWTQVSDATSYKLWENPGGTSGYSVIADNLTTTSYNHDIAVHRHNWPEARYKVQACNQNGCSDSNEVDTLSETLATIGYFKASNPMFNDNFGYSVALSADGNTLAVGALYEDSDTTFDATFDVGAVYVFTRDPITGTWSEQANVKSSNPGVWDGFGASVALSADGNILAVGAPYEDSDSDSDTTFDVGAVYVFTRDDNGTWSDTPVPIKASNPGENDNFGYSVALSADGNTLAVGAPYEDEDSDTTFDAGAVYVFTRSGNTWTLQKHVKASNTGADNYFGMSLALSADGNTLAVGQPGEDSGSGAVYVFTRDDNGTWSDTPVPIKASNPEDDDQFGRSLALSDDGNTLAVGAPYEDSIVTGVNNAQNDNSATSAGAVYVYTRDGSGNWSQQAYIKASNTGESDWFGESLALSADGNTLAVGAPYEDSNATGVGGDQNNDSAVNAGAVYVFTRDGSGTWLQQAYVKASNTGGGDQFGWSLALSADGNTLAVGAIGEGSNAKGVGGYQDDDSVESAGAVYLY